MLHRENKFSGNVLIAENGKPIFQRSYGLAFREKHDSLNSESIFELASIGKQFTAMAIMILKQEGKLKYEDSLRKFFPELPYINITIRHLLNHTSGLPDYMELVAPGMNHWDSTRIMTNKDMIALLAKIKPDVLFQPGEKWEYSNTGYALLASIVEKVSGLTFKEFMAKAIYQPLGMNRSLVYHKRLEQRIVDNYAYGYVFDKKKRDYVMADSSEYASMVYSLDGIYGDGITNSTTTDLLKWDQSLYTEQLVSKETMQDAFSPAPLNGGKTYDYGFGWLFRDTKEFGRIVFHSGGWPGYSTWIERHPRDNKTIIILANAGNGMSRIQSVRKILYGIEDGPPREIKLSAKILKQYTGQYKLSDRDTITINFENNQLYGSGAGQKKHALYPEANDIFFRKDAEYKTQFVKNKKGKVEMLRILREGPSIEAIRISRQ
jgi:CubicO group peptidase (beta-lactamase class C family)